MYTDEANEIYLKVCEKYNREPLDTMHTRTMLFECINIALKQGQTLPIDSVRLSCFKEVFEKFQEIEHESEFYGWLYAKTHEA
jgi:hypothetical protein